MIIFESSPLWLIVCLLAAILSTCILYLRKSNECVSKRLKIVLMLLRGAAMFLLFALLLDIFIVNEHSSTEKPLIVCAADNSASMIAAADSSEVKSLFANYDNKIDKLQKKFTVKSLLFGSKITEDITTPDFKDNATDISSSILYANSLFGKNSIDAMLIVSDGIITDGFDLDITAQKTPYPIYIIGTGDTSQVADFAITKIRFNDIVYMQGNCVFEVNIKAVDFNNEKLILQIYDNGKMASSKSIDVTDNPFHTTQSIILSPASTGKHFYKFNLVSDKDDNNKANNEKTCVVNVIEGKKKIILVAGGAHPDVGAIKSSIEESNNFEVEVSMLTTMDIKTIENYDIIVTHGLPDKSAKSKLLFDKIKEAEMPSLTIISSNTDIEQLNNIDNNIRIESNNEQTEEAYPVFNNKFSAYKVDKEDEAVYNSFSPLNAPFGIYNLPAQSEILFYQKISDITTTRPLIALLQDFNIRHAYIFGEGIWLWKIKNYVADGSHRTFNSLVNNILQYLSLSDLFSFFRVETREEYYEGEDITINAFLYNDNYELYNTADAQMIVKNEISEVEFPHYFSASDDGSYSLNMGGLPEGRYSWHATAGDKVADGAFYVGKTNPEYYNMQANHKMLQAAAEITGGKFVTLTDADKLIRALQEDINNDKTFTVKQQKNLSSIIAIFAIIVLLLGIEWLLRRRAGIY